jgi:hypothetical protein
MRKVNQGQAHGIGNRPHQPGRGGHPPVGVEHQREAEDPAEAGYQATSRQNCFRQVQGRKVARLYLQSRSHHPASTSRDQDNEDGVSHPLQARPHVQLGDVQTGSNKGKTWNNEEHGPNVAAHMDHVDVKEQVAPA